MNGPTKDDESLGRVVEAEVGRTTVSGNPPVEATGRPEAGFGRDADSVGCTAEDESLTEDGNKSPIGSRSPAEEEGDSVGSTMMEGVPPVDPTITAGGVNERDDSSSG